MAAGSREMLTAQPRSPDAVEPLVETPVGSTEVVQAGRAAGLLIAAAVVTGVGNLGFNVLVARAGGAVDYGTFGALFTLLTIAGVLASATNYTVARRVAKAGALTGELLRRSLLAPWPWMLVTAALLAVSPLLQSYLHLSDPRPVLTTV
ncbi:MAG: hypothetical protein JOY80_02360, partial [Candidatus Dormibacteraeota bacterium]|nr:hypothetical protein [Candidatus Dormibacteraeota bacterium]